MKKKTMCLKCDKETMHYYFMMFPAGYFVCNVCGTVEGDDGKPTYHIYFHKLPSYKLLRKLFEFNGMNWEEDGEVHYVSDFKTFQAFRKWCVEGGVSFGRTLWGEAETYQELRKLFKQDGVNFAFKLKDGSDQLRDGYEELQKYVGDYELPEGVGTFTFEEE